MRRKYSQKPESIIRFNSNDFGRFKKYKGGKMEIGIVSIVDNSEYIQAPRIKMQFDSHYNLESKETKQAIIIPDPVKIKPLGNFDTFKGKNSWIRYNPPLRVFSPFFFLKSLSHIFCTTPNAIQWNYSR